MSKMRADPTAVYIAYGTNLVLEQSPECQALPHIIEGLKACGVFVNKISRLWQSLAWPNPNDPPFVNAILRAETSLGPFEVMQVLHDLESKAGRVRDGRRNGPRTLDLDLIAHGDAVINEGGLVLPHPRAHERRFVLGPLTDIDAGWVHPVLKKTAAELFETALIARDAYPLDEAAR